MEIKASLEKPHTEQQRINFLITNNDVRGYIIEETDEALIAKGYTDEELEEIEKERIGNLQCTKRVFILMLEELQLNYFEQILPVIEANRQAKLEWELCVELQRKNPLIDQLASQFSITSEQLDILFKVANGELSVEDLRATV